MNVNSTQQINFAPLDKLTAHKPNKHAMLYAVFTDKRLIISGLFFALATWAMLSTDPDNLVRIRTLAALSGVSGLIFMMELWKRIARKRWLATFILVDITLFIAFIIAVCVTDNTAIISLLGITSIVCLLPLILLAGFILPFSLGLLLIMVREGNFRIFKDMPVKDRMPILNDFTQSNGFTFEEPDSAKPDGTRGSLFSVGDPESTNDVITGTIANFPFRYFLYSYFTGGERDAILHDTAVMEISLPHAIPQMVLDSLVEQTYSDQGSTLPLLFDNSQRVELEGNFAKYFKLYIPDKTAAQALSLLTPDIMEVIMQYGAGCDIEIIQDKMYFYWSDTSVTRQRFQDQFETVQHILARIGDKLTQGSLIGASGTAGLHSKVLPSKLVRRHIGPIGIVLYAVIAVAIIMVLYFPGVIFNKLSGSTQGVVIISMSVIALGDMLRASRLWYLWRRHRLERQYASDVPYGQK